MDRLIQRTAVRYDCAGHDYENTTLFPCIHKSREGVESAVLFQLKYSSKPMWGIVYKSFPLNNGECWNIQACLVNGDNETSKSVVAALEFTAAAPGCYLSTDFPSQMKLKGCSLGLSVAACVVGCPGEFAYTGWITGYGNDGGKWVVGPVEGTATKIKHCAELGLPIFVAKKCLEEDNCTRARCSLGRYYRFCDYMKGVPYHDFYEAVECESIAELMIMSQAIAYQRMLAGEAVEE